MLIVYLMYCHLLYSFPRYIGIRLDSFGEDAQMQHHSDRSLQIYSAHIQRLEEADLIYLEKQF